MRLTRRDAVRLLAAAGGSLPLLALPGVAFGDDETAEKPQPEPKTEPKREPTRVDRALDWLVRHQDPSGTWSDAEFTTRCEGQACTATHERSPVETTASTLLLFLACGETHQSKTYGDTVKNGLRSLFNHGSKDGRFGDLAGRAGLREHIEGALAVIEAYGLTGSRLFKARGQNAARWLVSRQRDSGAWGVDGDDARLTGQAALVLRVTGQADLEVSAEAVERTYTWLAGQADAKTGRVADDDSATALALLARVWLSDVATARKDPLVAKAAAHLAERDIKKLGSGTITHATWALHQAGSDDAWGAWLKQLVALAGKRQVAGETACARGSISPRPGEGRVTATVHTARALATVWTYRRVFGDR